MCVCVIRITATAAAAAATTTTRYIRKSGRTTGGDRWAAEKIQFPRSRHDWGSLRHNIIHQSNMAAIATAATTAAASNYYSVPMTPPHSWPPPPPPSSTRAAVFLLRFSIIIISLLLIPHYDRFPVIWITPTTAIACTTAQQTVDACCASPPYKP